MKKEDIILKLRIAWQWMGYDHEYDKEAIRQAEKGLEEVIKYFEEQLE